MTKSQAKALKDLANVTCRPRLFERGLSSEEAQRRIDELRHDIELANRF